MAIIHADVFMEDFDVLIRMSRDKLRWICFVLRQLVLSRSPAKCIWIHFSCPTCAAEIVFVQPPAGALGKSGNMAFLTYPKLVTLYLAGMCGGLI